jgi:16S rRNA (guanine527-N7)-methyltransferase
VLSEDQHRQLGRYLDLLLEGNARMNLTRITDRADAELRHVGDSLTLLAFLPQGEQRIADVGSGGGVPGIVVAIARPDARVVLIESTKKKAAFLRATIEALGLSNMAVSDQRVEDLGRSALHREGYDVVTARAVATMNWLIEWCLPLVKKGGKFLAMKGPKVHEELEHVQKVLNMTGDGTPVIHPVELTGMENHLIVEIEKVRKSDPQVPRPATLAKGKPL